MTRRRAPVPCLLALAFVAAACGANASQPPPAASNGAGLIVGCSNIAAAECEFVAQLLVAAVPPARRPVLSVEIGLFSCPDGGRSCPLSLAARSGDAVVDLGDGLEPLRFTLAGPAANPHVAPLHGIWSGLLAPKSPRVSGVGPFPFELGHCGISHVVDFDGSFWIPVGQVDGDAPEAINAGSGHIRIVGSDRAQYLGPGLLVTLARFPGPKHFWLCD
jgi:hypothetical protein